MERRHLCTALCALVLTACGERSSPSSASRADITDPEPKAFEWPARPVLLPVVAKGKAGGQLDPDRPGFVWDPISYLARPPGIDYEMHGYVEAPGQFVHVRTNALGMREDDEPSMEQPDLRILVAGDSHTDGAVANQYSFANVLEARLCEQRATASIEVLNAGVAYTSFPNYLGTLYKHLDLKPDVFVMSVYTGNDFGALYELHTRLSGGKLEIPPASYWEKSASAIGVRIGPLSGEQGVSQAWNQLWFFRQYPARAEECLALAIDYTRAAAQLCEQQGIRLIVLGIPTATEIEPERFAALRTALDQHFELDERTRERNTDLRERFGKALAQDGIEWLDGTHALRAAAARGEGPLYWINDQHIAIEAHRVLAHALLECL